MVECNKFNPDWDAQTLAEAAAINADKARLAAATVAAQELKSEALARAEALDKVSTKIYDHPTSVRTREELKAAQKRA